MDDGSRNADLESFVAEMVAQGRYPDRYAVVQAGVALLQRAEAEPGRLREIAGRQHRGRRAGRLSERRRGRSAGACDDRPEKHDHGVSRLRNFAPRAAAHLDEAVSWMLDGPAGAAGACVGPVPVLGVTRPALSAGL